MSRKNAAHRGASGTVAGAGRAPRLSWGSEQPGRGSSRYADQLAGKVVIRHHQPGVTRALDGLLVPPDSCCDRRVRRSARRPSANFVKAFNTTFAGTLVEGEVAGQPLDVYIAGDDHTAKRTVAALVREAR